VDWFGGIMLGGRLTRALARIATDRVLEMQGSALPRTELQIARSQAVNSLLDDQTDASHPRVSRVSLPGVRFESSNCQNFLIEVEWEGAHRGDDESLPGTLYVKLPCRELGTRAFANAIGFWAVECAFARNVASRVPIRVPRVYAVAERGTRFVLLLENLHEDPSTRLFTNRDMAAGTTLERAHVCLEAFAKLHAGFWDAGRASRDALLPPALHTYLAPGGRRLTRTLAEAAIGPAQRAAPDLFKDPHAAICRRAVAKWDSLVDAWYTGPLTLIHGDSHLANCFEYEHEGATRVGMIDFQGMQWCHGVRDLQYHLINSMDPGLLARHESDLIDRYVDALGRRGIELDATEARERYRAYSFQTLMVALTTIGLGSLTERDDTLRSVLARSVAAIDRLDFGGWLDRL
jgi:hypothetical protein